MAAATDAKGRGGANAASVFRLEPSGSGSKVLVHTNLTLSGAIRYDHTASFFPQQQVGPNPFIAVPTVFSAQDGTSYSDITPRVGVAYDDYGGLYAVELFSAT